MYFDNLTITGLLAAGLYLLLPLLFGREILRVEEQEPHPPTVADRPTSPAVESGCAAEPCRGI